MSEPQCSVCDIGTVFPMLPANQHRNFGTICSDCDMRELDLIERWRGGPIPASVQAKLEAWRNRRDEHIENETG